MKKTAKTVRNAADSAETIPLIKRVEDKFYVKRDEIRENNPNTEQRLFRAIQWTKHGLEANSMVDRIILLWIAFNALYGQEEHQERRVIGASSLPPFADFLERVAKRGFADVAAAMRGCEDACVEIIKCQYVYQQYWNAMSSGAEWRKRFDERNGRAIKRIREGNASGALPEVFRRVSVLRNQLLHGGAAFFGDDVYNNWGNARETQRQREDESHPFNGTQIRAGDEILQALTPVFVSVVMNNHDKEDWGILSYPPQARPDQKTAQPSRLQQGK